MTQPFSGLDTIATCTSIASCLSEQGIVFLGRYYSSTTQIEGKVLTPGEASAISCAGLQLVAVYEDDPVDAEYFTQDRGTADATAALAQAALVHQPGGSAIYFTVDYDASLPDVNGNIATYFAAVKSTLDSAYRVGVYGSGLVCSTLVQQGLAALGWLSQSTGYQGYAGYSTWAIKQGAPRTLCGATFDLDLGQGDIGAFSVRSASIGSPA
jgi:hypothetical protein